MHFRCAGCGLITVPERVPGDELASYIGGGADSVFFRDGNEHYYLDESNEMSARAKLAWVSEYVPSGSRLLDAGSNFGHFLQVARAAYAASGFDVSPVAICWSHEHLGVNAVTASIYDLSQFASASFDVVTAWDVIEHLVNPLEALRQLHRVLRPGGLIFVSTPDAGSRVARALGGHWHYLDPEQHRTLFSRATLRSALERSGFRVRALRTFGRHYRAGYVIDRLRHVHPGIAAVIPERAAAYLRARLAFKVYIDLGDVCGIMAERVNGNPTNA